MKKTLKYATWFLIVGCIVALGLCYIIIPERTKYAIDVAIDYANRPLGIVCGTTITLGAIVGIIIKVIYDRHKTSIKDITEETRTYAQEQKKQAQDYYELAKKHEEQVKEVLSCYSNEIDNVVEKVAVVCETSPNAKIKALAPVIREETKEFKEEIKVKLEETNNTYSNVVKEKEDKIKELEDKVAYLTEQLERLVEQYGKETTND